MDSLFCILHYTIIVHHMVFEAMRSLFLFIMLIVQYFNDTNKHYTLSVIVSFYVVAYTNSMACKNQSTLCLDSHHNNFVTLYIHAAHNASYSSFPSYSKSTVVLVRLLSAQWWPPPSESAAAPPYTRLHGNN